MKGVFGFSRLMGYFRFRHVVMEVRYRNVLPSFYIDCALTTNGVPIPWGWVGGETSSSGVPDEGIYYNIIHYTTLRELRSAL